MAAARSARFALVTLLGLGVIAGFLTMLVARRSSSMEAYEDARQARVAFRSSREPVRVAPAPASAAGTDAEAARPAGAGRALLAAPEAPESGYDLAADWKEAALVLADRLRRELRDRREFSGARFDHIAIEPADEGDLDERRFSNELATRLADVLQRRDLSVFRNLNLPGMDVTGFRVAVRDLEDDRLFATVGSQYGGTEFVVIVDPSIARRSGQTSRESHSVYFTHSEGTDWGTLRPIRFATRPTLDSEAAQGDGLEALARRVRTALVERSVHRGWIDDDLRTESEFRARIGKTFDDAALVGLGDTRMFPVTFELEDDDLYGTQVSWTAETSRLDQAARLVTQQLHAERQEPWIRMGLAIGAGILVVLGWLRLDWMLKGRRGWLTKPLALAVLAGTWAIIYNVDLFRV